MVEFQAIGERVRTAAFSGSGGLSRKEFFVLKGLFRMKKAVSILLAFVFALACAMPAFAGEGDKYKCGVCNSSFETAEQLDNHYIKCHSSQPTTAYLVCPYCDNIFSDEDSFNDHIVICADQQRAGSGDFSITSMLDRMISVYETTASEMHPKS